MPAYHHRIATVQSDGRSESQPPPPKPNPKFLSIILKAVIMTAVTSIFFLFLGVAAILLLNLCLAGGTLRRRFRTHHADPSNGLSAQDVRKLSQFQFGGSDQEKECVVCLERIEQGQWCRKLVGCGHVFHRRCVDMWLVKVAACPICRSRVGLDYGSVGSLAIADDLCRNSELRVG